MPDYPRAFDLEPITDWPGELTSRREYSQFKATIGTTMRELATELDQIGGKEPRLAIAVTRDQLRIDGRLRAGQTPYHPGIILSFDSPRGSMRYANDRFTTWQHNLRGIVKELEALRGISRWVNNAGQQYGGFLAIESAIAVPSAPFTDARGAKRWLFALIGYAGSPDATGTAWLSVIREAQRKTHPDRGGDPEQFRLVTLAEGYIREASK